MSGLESTGFVRKTLQEILSSIKQNAINEFGNDFNVGDDSVFMQLAGPFAVELDNIWQAAEAAYDSYTVNGAEGVHLDNYLSFFGITRLDASPSEGTVFVASNTAVLVDPTVISGSQFTDSLGNIYVQKNASDTIGKDNTFAYKVAVNDLALSTTYNLTIRSTSGALETTAISVTDEASKQAALAAIKTHVETHRVDLVGKTYIDISGVYIGFDDAGMTYDPPVTSIEMYFDIPVGTRYSKIQVVSTENKFYSINEDSKFSINPTYSGYLSARAVGGFTTGSNVETDAEYRIRANAIVNTQLQSSAVSIVSAIINSGADDAIIYENPTDTPTTEVNQAYAIHPIVLGGNDTLIAEAIYSTIPVNISMLSLANGATVSESVSSGLGGVPVEITFSRASEVVLQTRLDYTTSSGTSLTTVEQDAVKEALASYIATLGISDNFNILRTINTVLSALSTNRLTALVVNVKEISEPTFQQTDYVAEFNEILRLPSANIAFSQV